MILQPGDTVLFLLPPEAAVINYPFFIPIWQGPSPEHQSVPPEHHSQAQRGWVTSSKSPNTAGDVVQYFSLTSPCLLAVHGGPEPRFSLTHGEKAKNPWGLAELEAGPRLEPRRAGIEITSSRISPSCWVSARSAAGSGHRMTWGLLGDPKAATAPHLCPHPRAGVASFEVAASAGLVP